MFYFHSTVFFLKLESSFTLVSVLLFCQKQKSVKILIFTELGISVVTERNRKSRFKSLRPWSGCHGQPTAQASEPGPVADGQVSA